MPSSKAQALAASSFTTASKMSSCQHDGLLRLVEEYRRTAGGHMEPDGKSVVCSCGDRWHFFDRNQLPEWLRAELRNRGL